MENNQNITNVNVRNNKLIIFVVGFVILLVIILVILFLSNNSGDSNQNSNINQESQMLPSNTCPSSLDMSSGKPMAIYNGKSVNMSQSTYEWVQVNCNLGNSNSNSDEDIIIENLGIEFGTYDEMTGRAGSFVFDKLALRGNSEFQKIFLEFGSTKTVNGEVISFPELVYQQVDSDTDVMALASGKVVELKEQNESNDYAVSVLFNDNWVVNYDHLTALNIRMGDLVESGEILGKVSLNRDGITGFTEIQIKKVVGNVTTSYCPTDLLSPAVKSTYENYLAKLMNDWEKYYEDATLYDEGAQTSIGCLRSTITE